MPSWSLPEVSPDGKLVSYCTAGGQARIVRAARFEDGAPVAFEAIAPGARPNTGRHRWMPEGNGFLVQVGNEKGDLGIATQEFTAGKDTASTRRLVTGFAADSWTETLGVAPDGKRLAVSALQDSSNLLLAQGSTAWSRVRRRSAGRDRREVNDSGAFYMNLIPDPYPNLSNDDDLPGFEATIPVPTPIPSD
jgi:hypothetical protein